jgi:hypothetical protein
MRDRFSYEEKQLAKGVLSKVARYRKSMSEDRVYRRIMDELQKDVARSPWWGWMQDQPRFETSVAEVQRMVWAALAIVEGAY